VLENWLDDREPPGKNLTGKRMVSLEGKLAMVTGAAGVVGQAVTQSLIEDGMRVVMVDLDQARLDTLAAGFGVTAIPLALDISEPELVVEAWEKLRQAHGDVEVLINNAGLLTNNKAVETTTEEWRKLMSVNLDGGFYLSRECLPGMRANKWGRIINICSLAMKTGGLTAGTAYTTSKGGMGALTFSLARECASDGITVNGIAPAYIKTPMVTEQLSEAQRQQLLNDIPVGRFCEAEEIGHVVRFLTSPLAGFITGEIIDINGGLHLD
jgi:3-oxoacyl-[acyl-carrier protein] reductase